MTTFIVNPIHTSLRQLCFDGLALPSIYTQKHNGDDEPENWI